ncbi:MAG: XdhC family protein [Pseudomonadota bacterium]
MRFLKNIFPTLVQRIELGHRVSLVTIVAVEGSSPRPLGSMAGVTDRGQLIGSITEGCTEKAIVAEAQELIRARLNRTVRYGAGSPYMDLKLACGSGIDVYFETVRANEIVLRAYESMKSRKTLFLTVDTKSNASRLSENLDTTTKLNVLSIALEPEPVLFCFGDGQNFVSLCLLAREAGYTVKAFTTTVDAIPLFESVGITCTLVHPDFPYGDLPWDRYSCVVTMFHNHEWEAKILHAALDSDVWYIGSLGSVNTHKLRLKRLREMPSTRQDLSVIRGPVGLNIGAKDPAEIGISVLAEMTAIRRNGS